MWTLIGLQATISFSPLFIGEANVTTLRAVSRVPEVSFSPLFIGEANVTPGIQTDV